MKTIQENRRKILNQKNLKIKDQIEQLANWAQTHLLSLWLGDQLLAFDFLKDWLTPYLERLEKVKNHFYHGPASSLIWCQDPMEILWLLDLLPQLWVAGSYTLVLVSQRSSASLLTSLKNHLVYPEQLDVFETKPQWVEFLAPLPIWNYKIGLLAPSDNPCPQAVKNFNYLLILGKSFALWLDDQFLEENLQALWDNIYQGFGLGFWSCQRLLVPQTLMKSFLEQWETWISRQNVPDSPLWPEPQGQSESFWELIKESYQAQWRVYRGISWAWNVSMCSSQHQKRWNHCAFIIQDIKYPFEAIKWLQSMNHPIWGLWVFRNSQQPWPSLKPPVFTFLEGTQWRKIYQLPLTYPWPRVTWQPWTG